MYADLHIHTFFSDGSQSPEEVVRCAKDKGLSVISICDHNSIAAYDRLRPACEAVGIRLVQGVELEVYWRDMRLHLLAYAFDPNDAAMTELMRKSWNELEQVSVKLIIEMENEGKLVSLKDYNTYDMPLGRGAWKGINYLFDKGLCDNLNDWAKYYREYDPYHPDFYAIDNACRIIEAAGGVPVLAHPGNWWHEMPPDFQAILSELQSCGIKGIECFYPSHTAQLTGVCMKYCRQKELRITCGCDGHGDFSKFINGVEYDIGIVKTDMELLDLRGIL